MPTVLRSITTTLLLSALVIGAGLSVTGCGMKQAELRKKKEEQIVEALKEENPALFDPALAIEKWPKAPDLFYVQLRTSKGGCWIEIHRDWAPRAADRFYQLIEAEYFTFAPCYRAIENQFVQFGISIQAEIGKAWREATFEPDPQRKSNVTGYVGMAPDHTRGMKHNTQIYINLDDNDINLDGQGYVPFGKVVRGLGKVRGINTDYAEIKQEGNPVGVDMERGWEIGRKYFMKNFPRLDVIRGAAISDRPDIVQDPQRRRTIPENAMTKEEYEQHMKRMEEQKQNQR